MLRESLSHIWSSCRECLTCIDLLSSQCSMTDNARTTRCALKREQVVFIRRRRFHSTRLRKWFLFNLFEKMISIQLIWKSRLHSTHSKKSSLFISFEQVVLIRSSLFLRISFNSFEKVVIYLINLKKPFFIQLIWKCASLLTNLSFSSRTWSKPLWHSSLDVDEKSFDLKQTCKWKHFSSYTSISVSVLHSLKNIHQQFSSHTSVSVSVLYSLKNIHQHFSSHTSVSVSMLHSLRNLLIFQQLDYLRNLHIF
jgi:hypothetical protein